MKNKIYAISLLLSFLVALGHQVFPHHHHDTVAKDFSLIHSGQDEDKHEHNDKHHHHHDSQEKSDDKKDSRKDHNHPFPLHQHVSSSDDFIRARTNIQESNSVNHNIKVVTVLCLFNLEYVETANLTKCSFGEPPFLINSLFEPGAIALRGPPSIV